jgi:type 1 glutamine amidotransferase
VTVVPDAKEHPILRGVAGYKSPSWLYKVRPLTKSTTPLLVGTYANEEPEPVAWTNEYQKARIFYTSLGHWDDFKQPAFTQLLINATFWALKRPVPK